MASRYGTVRQRILGRRLRGLRVQSGHTLESAAAALEISPSKLARTENAQQGVDVHFVRSVLDMCDVGGDQWTEMLQLTRDARAKPWWAPYLTGARFGYVQLETDAVQVQEYAPGFVPGLLQTRAYAHAVFASSLAGWTPEQLENNITVRLLRQRRLTDDDNPLDFLAVVDEAVFHNPFGGPAVMREQLMRVIEAVELPTVTLQVLPTGSGPHASLTGSFSVLSFGDLGEPDLAYVEHALGAAHYEDEAEVLRARKKFDELRTLALSPVDTLALLREIALAL